MTDRMRMALESIAAWHNVNISGEYEHGLRDIIRSITDCAAAALEASVPAQETWKCGANPRAVVPEDCDWPNCGCDPHAQRVMQGLIECGWEAPAQRMPDDTPHYLGAIRLRLEELYEKSHDPRAREQISDEVDWITGQIDALTLAFPSTKSGGSDA